MKKIISSPNAPAAIGPYSHAVMINGTLFTSGQIPLVPETGKLVEGDVKIQVNQVLNNLESVLAANNMTFANVIKTTIFLTDLGDFQVVNEEYAKRFTGDYPARSCVQVAALPAGAKLEIELIASDN